VSFDCIETRRGVGMMHGLVFNRAVGDIIVKAMDKGLVLINAGTDIYKVCTVAYHYQRECRRHDSNFTGKHP